MKTIEVNPCANGALIKAYYDGNNDIIVFERGGLALGHVKAKPVVHGKWVANSKGILSCSNCKAVKPYDVYGDDISYWTGDYCRCCGADMRGDSDD